MILYYIVNLSEKDPGNRNQTENDFLHIISGFSNIILCSEASIWSHLSPQKR